jgi:hypothetical protein
MTAIRKKTSLRSAAGYSGRHPFSAAALKKAAHCGPFRILEALTPTPHISA